MRSTPVSLSPARIARWIGAAPRQRGKQRGMHVPAAEAWIVEHASRKDQSIGDDDDEIGRVVGEPLLRGGIFQRLRLFDRDAVRRARVA